MSLARRLTFAYTKQNKPLRAPERASRASFPPPLKGSMTLEAAAAIPLFLFFVMNLLFIFEAVRLQSGLQAALQQAGEQVCEAAYYTKFGAESGTEAAGGDTTDSDSGGGGGAMSLLVSETYVRNKVTSYLGNAFWNHTCIVGGKAGLSFAQSRIMTEGDRVEIIVNLRIRPFVRVVAFPDFAMQARYCGHAWVGWTPGTGPAETGSGTGGDRKRHREQRKSLCYEVRGGIPHGSGMHISQSPGPGSACFTGRQHEKRRRLNLPSVRVLQTRRKRDRVYHKRREPVSCRPKLRGNSEAHFHSRERGCKRSLQALPGLRRRTSGRPLTAKAD